VKNWSSIETFPESGRQPEEKVLEAGLMYLQLKYWRRQCQYDGFLDLQFECLKCSDDIFEAHTESSSFSLQG
jgi:hypothetical protein